MAMRPSLSRSPRVRFVWPWLLVGAAWSVAIIATLSGWRILIDHHFLLEESGLSWPVAGVVFLAGWQAMIVAMMIPSIVLRLAQTPADQWHGAVQYTTLAVCFIGYACVWTLFGFLAFTGDTVIHHVVDRWPWLAAHSYVIGATTLAIAGIFQFTPWKAACLARCREFHGSSMSTASMRFAWSSGIRDGVASVGCCWALMLVMFGIGVGELGWMVALTATMAGEIAVPGGARSRLICQAVGVVLLLLAGLWLAHPAWLGPVAASCCAKPTWRAPPSARPPCATATSEAPASATRTSRAAICAARTSPR